MRLLRFVPFLVCGAWGDLPAFWVATAATPPSTPISHVVPARPDDPWTLTNDFVASCRNADGGFGPAPNQPSTLGATSAATRVLKCLGGTLDDPLSVLKFVHACWDRTSGGFAPTPGGTPDPNTTSVGLMVWADLRIDQPEEVPPRALAYLSDQARDFDTIRLAVAGVEAVGGPSKLDPAVRDAWREQILARRRPDGLFGEGDRPNAFATGSAFVALMRLGQPPEELARDRVIALILDQQCSDGGWSDGSSPEAPSTLSATYRIVRALRMTNTPPRDLDALRSFIAACRNPDGSFRNRPDAPVEDRSATYFAAILHQWSRELDHLPAVVETAGFQPLFDGRTLTGWEGGAPGLWTVRDGVLVGDSPGIAKNDFLATEEEFEDFILKLSFRLTGGPDANSGVQFRSARIPNSHEMIGYQADIGKGYWGSLYDESRRNRVLAAGRKEAVDSVAVNGWNTYEIRAIGPDIRLTLNGVPSVAYREQDEAIPRRGQIAVQVHSGGPLKVEFQELWIQRLPHLTSDARPDGVAPTPNVPGFHRRYLQPAQAGEDPRAYTVWLPPAYDGVKTFPILIFLHGSGERGFDGLAPAQVGLGPALVNHPDRYPYVVLFPQARERWSGDGTDMDAVVALLDDVTASYKVDPNRVALTGLSMGGAGCWNLALRMPERFRAVAPVCGFVDPARVTPLKNVPFWVVVGDADRLLPGSRGPVQALEALGARPVYKEHRGVGHNSWDRAYDDPAFARWLAERLEVHDGE